MVSWTFSSSISTLTAVCDFERERQDSRSVEGGGYSQASLGFLNSTVFRSRGRIESERMRIRKRGNSRTSGEFSGVQQQQTGGGGSNVQEERRDETVEGGVMTARDAEEPAIDVNHSPNLVVDLWLSGRGTSHMNLDEFVSSLARENCFPAEEHMSTVHSDNPSFQRLAGGSSSAYGSHNYAELDTSLRLGQASHPAMATGLERGKGIVDDLKEFESDPDNLEPGFHVWRRNLPRARYDADLSGDTRLERSSEKNASPPCSIEACDAGDSARHTVSSLEVALPGLESFPSDYQTMKSSTESMETWSSKKKRDSSIPDRPQRRRLSSPTIADELQAADHPANQPRSSLIFSLYTVFHELGQVGLTAKQAMSMITERDLPGFEDIECRSRRHVTKLLRSSPYFMELGDGKFALCSAMIEEEGGASSEEVATSDSSHEQVEESPIGAGNLPISSSPDNEERRTEVELERKVEEGAPSQQPERKRSGRSGRPKRLKYLKQDNVEELGNQCNRSDGKGWTCPLLAKTGYQLCDHHLDKLRCKPGSRSKYNKKK